MARACVQLQTSIARLIDDSTAYDHDPRLLGRSVMDHFDYVMYGKAEMSDSSAWQMLGTSCLQVYKKEVKKEENLAAPCRSNLRQSSFFINSGQLMPDGVGILRRPADEVLPSVSTGLRAFAGFGQTAFSHADPKIFEAEHREPLLGQESPSNRNPPTSPNSKKSSVLKTPKPLPRIRNFAEAASGGCSACGAPMPASRV